MAPTFGRPFWFKDLEGRGRGTGSKLCATVHGRFGVVLWVQWLRGREQPSALDTPEGRPAALFEHCSQLS